MLDLARFSTRYAVRFMQDTDADMLLAFMLENTQYLQYCGASPTRESVLSDLTITPPGVDQADKYYVGFYGDTELVAILDLIDGYPETDCAYIGFFMMNKLLQGQGVGSGIIRGLCQYLKENGKKSIELGIDKGNPQASHFWKKNGFEILREVRRGEARYLVAEKTL